MTNLIPTSGHAATTAYEALRSTLLSGSTTGGQSGLVVVLRKGVAAWMASRFTDSAPIPPAACSPAPQVRDEIHAAIVRMLAGMVLAGQREVRA